MTTATNTHHPAEFPSEVSADIGFFDRLAGAAALIASRATFFTICVFLVVAWMLQGAIVVLATGDWSSLISSTYQLEINTTTTIITFLMVALLQNSQMRNDLAIHHKLNAIADALGDLMAHTQVDEPDALARDIRELKLAVGLEERESSSHNEAESTDQVGASPGSS